MRQKKKLGRRRGDEENTVDTVGERSEECRRGDEKMRRRGMKKIRGGEEKRCDEGKVRERGTGRDKGDKG